MAAVARFAGPEPEKAVVETEAQAVLTSFEKFVTHFEIACSTKLGDHGTRLALQKRTHPSQSSDALTLIRDVREVPIWSDELYTTVRRRT